MLCFQFFLRGSIECEKEKNSMPASDQIKNDQQLTFIYDSWTEQQRPINIKSIKRYRNSNISINKHKVLRRWQPHYIIYTAIHLSKSNVIAITISSARLIIFILFIILIRFCAIKGANTAATTSQSQQTQCYWLN